MCRKKKGHEGDREGMVRERGRILEKHNVPKNREGQRMESRQSEMLQIHQERKIRYCPRDLAAKKSSGFLTWQSSSKIGQRSDKQVLKLKIFFSWGSYLLLTTCLLRHSFCSWVCVPVRRSYVFVFGVSFLSYGTSTALTQWKVHPTVFAIPCTSISSPKNYPLLVRVHPSCVPYYSH